MFQISIGTLQDDYTGIKVFRNTKKALKEEGVTTFTQLQQPGNSVRFETLMNVKTAREATDAFNILNNYVQWRGDDYVEELYKAYEIISTLTQSYIMASDVQSDSVRNKFIIQLGNIINLLDIDQIYFYITEIEPIPIPPNLEVNFKTSLETDGLGTRDQTYIVEDYKKLMSLITIFKATYGPLAELIHGNPDYYMELKEIQMLDLFKQQEIYKHESFRKLQKYVSAIVDRTFMKEKLTDVKIISTRLNLESIKELYLSKSIFGRMITMNQLDDPDKFDIVKYVYKDVNSKIKNLGGPDEVIRNKNKPSESGSELEDKESVIESYRISTEIPPGMTEEFNWALRDAETILNQLPASVKDHIDMEDVKIGLQVAERFEPGNITNTHIMLFATLFKRIVDARAVDYERIESVRRQIGIGYAILKSYGCHPLAYILVSKRIPTNNAVMDLSLNINSTKAKGYREDELEQLFSFRLKDSKTGEPGDLKVLDWIHAVYLEIFKHSWQPPVELNIGIRDMLVPTLRNCLVDFLIENERRLNG